MKKLSRPVKARAEWSGEGFWTAYETDGASFGVPCFVVPRALWRKAQAELKVMREVRCRRVVGCGASKQALYPVTQDEAAKLWNARAK